MTRTRSTQRLGQLLVLMGISYFVLWACGPMMSAPPSPPMPPLVEGEVGHGLGGGAIFERAGWAMPMAGYQFWHRRPVGLKKRNEAGALAQVGWIGLGGGGYYRYSLIRKEKLYLGTQFAGGFIWGEVSLPVAAKVGDKVWLTTQPSFKYQLFSDLHVPVGLSWEMGEHGRLDTQLGVHFLSVDMDQQFPDVVAGLTEFKDMGPYIGIGYARQFGAKNQ